MFLLKKCLDIGVHSNGITLTSTIVSEFEGRNIDLSSDIDGDPIIQDVFSTLNALDAFSDGSHGLVSSTFARTHLSMSLQAMQEKEENDQDKGDGSDDDQGSDDGGDDSSNNGDGGDKGDSSDESGLAYWPISDGNEWEYCSTNADWHEHEIIAVSIDTFKVRTETSLDSSYSVSTYEIGDEYIGLKEVESSGPGYQTIVTYSPANPVLPIRMEEGTSVYKSYTQKIQSNGYENSYNGHTKITLYGQYDVSVPAGTFDAVKIKVDQEIDGKSSSNIRYYSKGVGFVKAEANDFKLEDFDIK